ncbi:retrovirus-related pol polyprotein from transposon TNT 1-94 [Tanacetum coccineum]
MKQNRNMSKSSSRDNEVNQAARDSNDTFVCCVENTVEDRIMDSGASFHATYYKEELERFKLRSGKVRLADDKTLNIAGVGDVILKTSFSTSWTLKDVRYIPGLKRRLISVGQLDEEGYHVGFGDQQWKVTKGSLMVARGNKRRSLYMVEVHPERIGVIIDGSGSAAMWHQRLGDMSRIGMNMLASKGNVLDVWKVDIYFCKPSGLGKQKKLSFIMSEKIRKLQRLEQNGIMMLKIVSKTPLQFGVAERLSRTFRAESTRLRLRISEEEWRGKDTSLAHLKSHQFIRSRDITFVDSIYGARSATDSSSLTKPIQKSQVVLVDISENRAENDSIVAEHGLSSENHSEPRLELRYEAPARYSPSANYLLLIENDKPEFQKPLITSRKESITKLVDVQGQKRTELQRNVQGSVDLYSCRSLLIEGSLYLLKILGTKSLAEMFTRLARKENLKLYASSTGLRDKIPCIESLLALLLVNNIVKGKMLFEVYRDYLRWRAVKRVLLSAFGTEALSSRLGLGCCGLTGHRFSFGICGYVGFYIADRVVRVGDLVVGEEYDIVADYLRLCFRGVWVGSKEWADKGGIMGDRAGTGINVSSMDCVEGNQFIIISHNTTGDILPVNFIVRLIFPWIPHYGVYWDVFMLGSAELLLGLHLAISAEFSNRCLCMLCSGATISVREGESGGGALAVGAFKAFGLLGSSSQGFALGFVNSGQLNYEAIGGIPAFAFRGACLILRNLSSASNKAMQFSSGGKRFCSWAKLVQILISEGSLYLLKILGTKSLAEMFTRLARKENLKLYASSTGLRDKVNNMKEEESCFEDLQRITEMESIEVIKPPNVTLANNLLLELNRYLDQLKNCDPEMLRLKSLRDHPLIKFGVTTMDKLARADIVNSQKLMSTRTDLMRTIVEKEELLRSYRAM